MKKRWWIVGSIVFVGIIAVVVLSQLEFEYAYIPDESELLNDQRGFFDGYDVWGERVPLDESASLAHSNIDSHQLSPDEGAVRVDEEFIQFGREQFYKETFNNEEYMTDVLGVIDGGITLPKMMKALIKLRGQGTNNLQVELDKDVTIGDKTYKKGELIDTGLDVPKGAYTPLGMPVSYSKGKVRVRASCASCHATVDRDTGKVVEGAPNNNFNAGMLLALAPNTTAFFPNTEVEVLEAYINDQKRTVKTSKGGDEPLPDPEKIEADVDQTIASWPKGTFDSTIDLESNPTQIPDSFTLEDHPYGWNGFATIGPFKGLSSLNNNVHAQNSDLLAQYEQSNELFDIDKEVYIGTILQNAADEEHRYDPQSGEKPSDFFAKVDDTPEVPGVNEMVKPPHFPKISLFSPNGTVINSPGYHFGEQINALSAYQNTLRPPSQARGAESSSLEGERVFNEAGCASCHAGEAYTNNQVIPVDELKTEKSRAKAFRDTVKIMEEPWVYTPDTPVPIPKGAKKIKVPTDKLDREQLNLTLAQGNEGGYKVKGLIGLAWSPPYLHDGGVSVGPDESKDLGIPGTLRKAIDPDARNSLRALVDRNLRQKVIEANKQDPSLQHVHVTGEGHEYWVDEKAGFTEAEREALIDYLMTRTSIEE